MVSEVESVIEWCRGGEDVWVEIRQQRIQLVQVVLHRRPRQQQCVLAPAYEAGTRCTGRPTNQDDDLRNTIGLGMTNQALARSSRDKPHGVCDGCVLVLDLVPFVQHKHPANVQTPPMCQCKVDDSANAGIRQETYSTPRATADNAGWFGCQTHSEAS
jgi:hypothetical protein